MKQAALPAVVIAGVIAVIVFSVVHGGDEEAAVVVPSVTRSTAGTLAGMVQFVSPVAGATVSNPVDVRMAVGGVKLEPATRAAAFGEGHLYLIIDGATPPAGTKLTGQAPDIDLADAAHEVTLPALSPGAHKLTVLFVDSNDYFNNGALKDSISITVAG